MAELIVNTGALLQNYRRYAEAGQVIPILKGNGYGLGAQPLRDLLARQGVTLFACATPEEALALARRYGAEIQYDETAQSPWFRYTAETGTVHEVWFEDARSSLAKLRLAADNGLQGVGLWNLMRDAPQTYLVLNGAFQVEKLA